MNEPIKLSKDIVNHWLYPDGRKFTEFEAFIDLLLIASDKPCKKRIGNKIIELKKRQLITSIRTLADKWQWSSHKVVDFLQHLVNEEIILKQSESRFTKITIIKDC